ncbi:unnamed protein product [Prorocentrum cordatum]|uniref:Uncharacterized protein n=1 Tax=Prorocentrum cordatum TaxID=2364126 RepID=A0ABN9SXU6_9DINO|nr:unnamed protein product [Polarella glacialis]
MFLLMPLFLLRVEVGAPGAAGGRLSGGCSRSSSGDSPRAGSGRKGVLRAGGGGPEIWESAGPSRGNGRAGQRAGRRAARGDGRLAATGDPPQGQQAAETRVGNLDPEALQKAPGHAGSSRGPAALGGGRSDHGQRVPRRRGGEGRGEEEEEEEEGGGGGGLGQAGRARADVAARRGGGMRAARQEVFLSNLERQAARGGGGTERLELWRKTASQPWLLPGRSWSRDGPLGQSARTGPRPLQHGLTGNTPPAGQLAGTVRKLRGGTSGAERTAIRRPQVPLAARAWPNQRAAMSKPRAAPSR